MDGSILRRSLVVLVLIIAAAATMYVLRDDGSIIAAQPGGGSGPCWHVGVSDYECPDSTSVRAYDEIASVTVTIEARDGRRISKKLPAGVDAIFLTKQSTEKFLLSYYWATNREKAEALTKKLTAMKDPVAKK